MVFPIRIESSIEVNILLALGILYSGNTMKIANVFFSHTLHLRPQKTVLFPEINFVYMQRRESILEHVQNLPLDFFGVGRCNSPGFNPRFFMNAHNNKTTDCHVMHVGVVGNSVRMEKMSLCTLLEKFRNVDVSIRSFTTDRHVQIRSYMSKEKNRHPTSV